MSLPSQVIFFKDGKEVRREFTNCGWITSDKFIKSGIRTSLMMINEKFEWDTAVAYGKEYKKEDLI